MSAHTHGPWKVVERGASFSSHEIRPVKLSQGAIPLAWVAKLNDGQANARLIAAAPDLLAALKALVDACDCGPDVHCRSCELGLRAVAKAEGKP